jgi:cobalt/nickel transport system ATP-binding protein
VIELRDVCCSYDGAPALSHVDLLVRQGEAVAFIGPIGSGKSTLLKLVNGIVLPDTGRYFLAGEEITRARLKEGGAARRMHRRIGFLFQNVDAQLFCPEVYDEVAFGPRQLGLDEADVDERVRDCLQLLDVGHLVHRAPHHLSEGEKRSVALAAVLALNPEILALDEPMNGLDPRTKRLMREVILSLHSAGKTILCSTHDFAYVEDLFARAVVISRDHSIARDGEYRAVLADHAFLADQNIV